MLTLEAPAKINWSLSVLGRRSDGYHDILSLMQRVTLSDTLRFEHSENLDVVTEAPIPLQDNLVYRAMRVLKERSGARGGARITLEKEIPLAAGLGGGSSDAATALMGLNMLWELGWTMPALAELGAGLGSDVPFFFHEPAAVISGRGELASPAGIGRTYVILLVKPALEVSAAWAYGEWDRLEAGRVLTKKDNNIKLFCQAIEEGDFSLLRSVRGNDLEAPVIAKYPVIAGIKETLIEKGALFVSMSGSGPTVYGVFGGEDKALKAMERMMPHWCRVVRTVTGRG